jgi:hypothetical protein
MSILLSAYFPEGIVFAADRNVTLLYGTPDDVKQDVEVGATTKVVPWAYRKAVVGYCGLGELAGLPMREWMQQFAAKTRDFDDLDKVATQMREEIQRDFNKDHPQGTNVEDAGLIIHLGGFKYESNVAVPAMYLISNVGIGLHGKYTEAIRDFSVSDELQTRVASVGAQGFRQWLEKFDEEGRLVWFNNGLYFPVFNVLKEGLWQTLNMLRKQPNVPLPQTSTLDDRVAYCKMAVELFDSFFRHHFRPSNRFVGGGADAEWVTWPEQ